MSKVYGIIGLGLIGASLAKALQVLDKNNQVIGLDNNKATVDFAIKNNIATVVTQDNYEALVKADIVVIAVPFSQLKNILPYLLQVLHSNQILTDVIGVKERVGELIRAWLPKVNYIGSHPMAGGPLSGIRNANESIFIGRDAAVCYNDSDNYLAKSIARMWRSVGARPIIMTEEEHDIRAALTSHFPYTISLASSRVVINYSTDLNSLTGSGLHTLLQRALFSPEIMATLLPTNKHLPQILRSMATQLSTIAMLCESEQNEKILKLAESTYEEVKANLEKTQ